MMWRGYVMMLICASISLQQSVLAIDAATHVVDTKLGRIVGTVEEVTTDNELNTRRQVQTFLGIPYAVPPVGPLRFEPPVVAPASEPLWNADEPFNATTLGYRCPQIYSDAFPVSGVFDEDCLNLDIYVPLPTPLKAAVMFWIHGGSYLMGAGTIDILNPSVLAAFGDVIIVAPNYRLGALGFLSTGDDAVPGNMGLLDQREAMRWVQNNIESFGGDPERVTIFGESAGGSSVSLHMLSPLSKGLFSGAIMQSGVALSPWAVNLNRKNNRIRTYTIGTMVGCHNESMTRLMECLRSVPATELAEATLTMSNGADINDDAIIPFSPVVDGFFLPAEPITLLKGKSFNPVNMMVGHTSHEAMLLVMKTWAMLQSQEATSEPYMDLTFFDMLLTIGKTREFLSNTIKRQAVEFVYLDHDVLRLKGGNYLDMFVQLNGDYWYVCPSDAFIKAFESAAGVSLYMYHMTHHPSMSLFNTPWSGACHADDLIFTFGANFNPESPFNLTLEEAQMSVQIMKYWSNFAKTGNPNLELPTTDHVHKLESGFDWPEFTASSLAYKELSLTMTNKRALKVKECQFWNDYLPELNNALEVKDQVCTSHNKVADDDKTCTDYTKP